MPDVVAGELERLARAKHADAVDPDPDSARVRPPGHRRAARLHGLMYERLREALKAAGLDEAFGFHSLRHCYGTALAAQGVPMRTLQEWMGHTRHPDHAALRRLLPEPR